MLINSNDVLNINEGFNLFEIDTDKDFNLDLNINKNCNIFIDIKDANNININGSINSDATIVFWNNSNNDIKTFENYNVLSNGNLNIAYGECNNNKTIRNVDVNLIEDNASALVSSASLVNCLKDYRIKVISKAKNTLGNMKNFAVVLKDGKLVIDAIGKIEKGAKRSKSHQVSRALCFNDKQSSTILPELLIDENDVEASHAMSIGRVDDKHLYYMMSRGLSLNECTSLLSLGYLLPIIDYIDDETLKNTLKKEIESKLENV